MRQARAATGTAIGRGRRLAATLLVGALLAGAAETAAQPASELDRAIALHTAGKRREALAAYRRVAASARPADERAAALNNACVLHVELGDLPAALADCRAALALRERLGDELSVAETANNLALALEALGQPGEAAAHYRRALALYHEAGDDESVAVVLGNLGAVAIAAGAYDEAMRLYRRAEALARAAPAQPWSAAQHRTARLNQGVVLEKVGAFGEALEIYRALLAAPGEDPRDRAALLVNSGVVLRNLGDPVAAAGAFEEAIELLASQGDLAALSNAWLNLALAHHLDLGRPRAAEAAYRAALALAERAGDRGEELQDLFYLGRLLSERGRLDEAEDAFERARRVAEASGSAEGRWSAREGLGRVAIRRGDLRHGVAHLLAALEEIERVRAGIRPPEWRAGYFGDKRAAFSATIDALVRLAAREPDAGHADRALVLVQRAKVRDLLDELGSRAPGRPASPGELRRAAADGTILEYFVAEGRMLLWTIHASGVALHDRGPAAPILETAARVHHRLARGGEPEAADLAALSAALLPAGVLDGRARRAAPLRIAPDGVLHYLPFELLTAPGAGRPLVDTATVAYLPSASTLAAAAARRGPGATALADLALLGMGAPATPRGPQLGDDVLLQPPLRAAAGELRAAARRMGGTAALFLGARATEANLRRIAPRGARVVHFATHSTVAEGPGGSASIHLTPAGGDDGRLGPREIGALDLRCGLVVLAACRTALPGPRDGGRSLASLTGSFLAAGAPAVVATLWDVDDAVTAAFMAQFYDGLGRGQPPAEALRRAKRRLRRDRSWNRAALWSAYVLVGDAPPLATRPHGRLAIAAALVALGSLALVRRRPWRLTRR